MNASYPDRCQRMDAEPAAGHRPGPVLSPIRRHWLLAALVLLFIGLSVPYAVKAGNEHRSAFLRWRPQILQLEDVDIYERYLYPNPPIMALLLRPLAQLPPVAGALAWFYVKAALALLALAWVFRLVENAGQPCPPWCQAVVILLSLRPILGDLTHGNVNLLILFLVAGALYAFRRRREFLSGVVLALAVACKVTPALFVFYFLWKRAWRPLCGCAVGLALFLWAMPACFLGWHENARKLLSWYQQMVEPYVLSGFVTPEHQNQSLPGLVFRLTTSSPSSSTFEGPAYVPLEYHNLVTLDPKLARWVVKGCMAAFALLVMWTCRTSTRAVEGCGRSGASTEPPQSLRLAAEFSLIILGMLLFSERTWKHHCVTLVLPFAVLVSHLATCRPRAAMRVYLIATLVGVLVLMSLTSTGPAESWSRLGKLAEVYGAYVWAYLLLVAALTVILLGRQAAPVRPSEATSRPTPPPIGWRPRAAAAPRTS